MMKNRYPRVLSVVRLPARPPSVSQARTPELVIRLPAPVNLGLVDGIPVQPVGY